MRFAYARYLIVVYAGLLLAGGAWCPAQPAFRLAAASGDSSATQPTGSKLDRSWSVVLIGLQKSMESQVEEVDLLTFISEAGERGLRLQAAIEEATKAFPQEKKALFVQCFAQTMRRTDVEPPQPRIQHNVIFHLWKEEILDADIDYLRVPSSALRRFMPPD